MRLILIFFISILPSFLYATTIPGCVSGTVETNVEDGVQIAGGDCGELNVNIGTLGGNIDVTDGDLTINGDITTITGSIDVCSSCSLTINGNITNLNGSITNNGTLTINGDIGDLDGSITNNATLTISGSITADGKLEVKGGGTTTLDGGSFESTGSDVVIESGSLLNLLNGSSVTASGKFDNNGNIDSDGKGNSIDAPTYDGTGDYDPFFPPCSPCVDNSSLPVDLIRFDNTCEDDGINFIWETATEINNDYFTLEYSSDTELWTEVVKITGNGTTNDRVKYSYHVERPKSSSYYRLIQTDYDGTQEIFETVYPNCGQFSELEFQPFPNPTQGNVEINLGNTYSGVAVEISNISGKIIRIENFDSTSDLFIQLPELKGIYFVNVQIPFVGRKSIRVIKN